MGERAPRGDLSHTAKDCKGTWHTHGAFTDKAAVPAFAKGAIFLTVTHRLAQTENVAGAEGPPVCLDYAGAGLNAFHDFPLLFPMIKIHFFKKEKFELNTKVE